MRRAISAPGVFRAARNRSRLREPRFFGGRRPHYEDRIRSHVVDRYVDPARGRGEATVTVVAGAVLRQLDLRRDYAPSVCSALRAKKFRAENDLALINEEGPKSKQSTTTTFTFQLRPGSAADAPGSSSLVAERPSRSGGELGAPTSDRGGRIETLASQVNARLDNVLRELAVLCERVAKLEGSVEGFLAGRRDRDTPQSRYDE